MFKTLRFISLSKDEPWNAPIQEMKSFEKPAVQRVIRIDPRPIAGFAIIIKREGGSFDIGGHFSLPLWDRSGLRCSLPKGPASERLNSHRKRVVYFPVLKPRVSNSCPREPLPRILHFPFSSVSVIAAALPPPSVHLARQSEPHISFEMMSSQRSEELAVECLFFRPQ